VKDTFKETDLPGKFFQGKLFLPRTFQAVKTWKLKNSRRKCWNRGCVVPLVKVKLKVNVDLYSVLSWTHL